MNVKSASQPILTLKEAKVDRLEIFKKLLAESIRKSARSKTVRIDEKVNDKTNNNDNNNNNNQSTRTTILSQQSEIINQSKILNAQKEDFLNPTPKPHFLNEKQLSLIMMKEEMLFDYHIDSFAYILHTNFDYCFRESWKIQLPELIEPLNPKKVHIQILHSCEGDYNRGRTSKDHWVCSYYDTNNIYIFDSIRSNALHEKHRLFLSRCFPNFSFESKTIFPEVQVQPNSVDCGVYAIAFATSLALGEWPVEKSFRYDHDQMRPHLLQIFQSGIISNFPKEMSVFDYRIGKKSKRKYNNYKNTFPTSAQKRFKSKKIINNNNYNNNNVTRITKSNVLQSYKESSSHLDSCQNQVIREDRIIDNESKSQSDDANYSNKRKAFLVSSKETPVTKKRKINEFPILNIEFQNIITQGKRLTDVRMKHKFCRIKTDEEEKVATAKEKLLKYKRNMCKQDTIKLKLSVEHYIQNLAEVVDKKVLLKKD